MGWSFQIALMAGALVVQAQDTQRITLVTERQKRSAEGWDQINSATVFSSGDRLRFRVSANFAGYLYVMNRGTSGGYELLFPRSDTGGDNRIEKGRDYVIPAARGWFKVSGPPGQDIVYWLISPVELGREYKPLPPPPAKDSTPPASMTPRCDDSIFKARGECIDNSAGVKPVKPGEPLPGNLAAVAGATPRELLFMQDKGGTVLSSPQPLAGPVVYELRLSHR